jgi:REP element-mobilizing transposase RayT
MRAETYFDKEQEAEYLFNTSGPFWHLYTPGNLTSIIFSGEEDFIFAMNLIAQTAVRYPEIKIYTFEIMNNHLHLILSGAEAVCHLMFNMIKERLGRYLRNKNRYINLSKFDCSLIRITDLKMLRNEIVYVNRNGYVARHDCTPYTYPWGAGIAIFNPTVRLISSTRYSELTVRQKRDICKSKDIDLPGELMVYGNVILPSSYCVLKKTELLFRDPHHYFSLLSKNWEAYSETAKRLGDKITITDEEMYGAVSALSAKEFGNKNPRLLAADTKIELARRMKTEYNASPKQIRNILKLDQSVIEELFGKFA